MNTNRNRAESQLDFGNVPETGAVEKENDPVRQYLRLISYGRVSTDEQNDPEKTSIDRQLQKNREYAERIGATIVAEYREDYTGTELSRPELNMVLRSMLDKNEADGLVCMKVDRMARSVEVFMTLWTMFTKRGKQLHFADSGLADMAKLDSLILTVMKASMSQEERKIIIERMMGGKYKKLEDGDVDAILGMTGRLPYGIKKIKTFDERGNLVSKKIVLDEPAASIVRQMFLWAAYGYTDGNPLSTMEIARILNSNKVALSAYQEEKGFHPTTINRILHNPMYAGVYVYNRLYSDNEGLTVHGKKRAKSHRSVRPKDKWFMYDLPEELRIVDSATWNLVQKNLTKNKHGSRRSTKMDFLLQGHIFCGSCGRSMTNAVSLSNQRGKYLTKRPTSKEVYAYRRYQCTAKNLAKAKVPTHTENFSMCKYPTKTINAPKVEYMIWQWLKWLLSDPDNIKKAVNNIREKSEYELSPKVVMLEATLTRIAEVEKTMQKIAKRISTEEDDYLYATMKANYNELKNELSGLIKQREKLQEEVSALSVSEREINNIWDVYEHLRERLSNEESITYENRRFLLNLFQVKAMFHYLEDENKDPHRIIVVTCVLGEAANCWFDVNDADKWLEVEKPSLYLQHDHLDDRERSTQKVEVRIEAKLDLDAPIDVTSEFEAMLNKSIQSVFIEPSRK